MMGERWCSREKRAAVSPPMMLMTSAMVSANGTIEHREGLVGYHSHAHSLCTSYKVISFRGRLKNCGFYKLTSVVLLG